MIVENNDFPTVLYCNGDFFRDSFYIICFDKFYVYVIILISCGIIVFDSSLMFEVMSQNCQNAMFVRRACFF